MAILGIESAIFRVPEPIEKLKPEDERAI